ncbi:hypothetical protein HWV62_7282 [Athelia sp. TMB]|nr:hypothetical protein HWV62_7282 [Athelia sp. TMB]
MDAYLLRIPTETAQIKSFNATSPFPVHHLISGSFRSLSLFLLAFDPLHRSLSLLQRIPAFGPHQYLARNEVGDRVYATSWAMPPALSAWAVNREKWQVEYVNSAPITATSSYITLPHPYTYLYSAGGPTGEVHDVDASTGGFGQKSQEFLFVPADKLAEADKTRVALRTGSHAVEISSRGHAFVPVLGTNSIWAYTVDPASGALNLASETLSPRPHDGPRHVVVSSDGSMLYSITEHTSFVDVYTITPTPALQYTQSVPVLPSSHDPAHFRGDTLRFTPDRRYLFATTRGSSSAHKGWLAVFSILDDGSLEEKERWETPTSGGKANAIELIAKPEETGAYIALTDDEPGAGGLWILEWDVDRGVRVVADWTGEQGKGGQWESMDGASHAIWLD